MSNVPYTPEPSQGRRAALARVDATYLGRAFGGLPRDALSFRPRFGDELVPVVVAESPSSPFYRLPPQGMRQHVYPNQGAGIFSMVGLQCVDGLVRVKRLMLFNETGTPLTFRINLWNSKDADANHPWNPAGGVVDLQRRSVPQGSLWRSDFLAAVTGSGNWADLAPVGAMSPPLFLRWIVPANSKEPVDFGSLVLYPQDVLYVVNTTADSPVIAAFDFEEVTAEVETSDPNG